MAAQVGIRGTAEPAMVAAALQTQKSRPFGRDFCWVLMVPVKGIEPSTFSLQVSCSTN